MALIGDTSELDTLMYGGKYMLPEAASYTMTTPWGVVSSDVSGGFVRQQLQFFNSPAQVQAVYKCVTKQRVDYLKAFIRRHECLPFIAALAVDTDTVEPYVVDVVGAPTWQENGFSGTCTLTYQVQPTPNAYYDEFLQWSGHALGDEPLEFANWIAKTANWDLPDAKQMPIDANGTTAAFVSGLYYDNTTPVGFSDLVTFSRLSAGSYIGTDGVLKTAAANEPRFESGGLLVEPQSTNVVTISEGWAATYGASTAWSHSAPDALGWITVTGGGQTGAIEGSYKDFAVHAQIWSSTSTFSLDIKKDIPYAFVIMSLNELNPDGFGSFSLVFSSDSALPSHPSLKVVDMGTWLRITHTRTFGSSGLALLRLYPFGSAIGASGSLTYRRVQVEKLSYATSYIKTTGAAATRAADSASVDMQPHTAGTIFCEFLSDAVAIERVVYTAGTVALKRLSTGAIAVTNGAVTVTSAVVPAGRVKAAIGYDGATLKLAVNGIVYSAASALPSVGVSIALGNTTFANVWQRSEAYDNARLVEVTQ